MKADSLAGRIPERVKRDIVDRTDMVSIVGEVVPLQRAGTSFKGVCPFHDEKTPSFHVNPHRKVYHCFGCQEGGDAIDFVRKTRGLSYIEALEMLADRAGVELVREQLDPETAARERAARTRRGRLLELNKAAQIFFVNQLGQEANRLVQDYLAGRGLDQETVERFGVSAAPAGWDALSRHLIDAGFEDEDLLEVGLAIRKREGRGVYDRFRERLMFPIWSAAGDLCGFGGRTVRTDGDVAKYMNSPESLLYKKSRQVFGLFQARSGIRKKGMAVLVEGNLDVMMLHQVGEDHAICPMGTAITDAQIREIKRFTDRVALVFDGDAAGRAAARKAVPLCVGNDLHGVWVSLPAGEDPDSYVRRFGVDAWRELIGSAPDLLTGYIDALVAEWDGSISGKAAIMQQVGGLLAGMSDPMGRDMARDYLGARLLDPRMGSNRAELQRYLRHVKPLQPKASREPRSPQALESSESPESPESPESKVDLGPPLAENERELARAAVWYPDLLAEIAATGVIDFLRHRDLRDALGQLCAHAGALDGPPSDDDVQTWVLELAQGPARNALLAALVEPPHVPAPKAVAWLEQVIDRMEITALNEQLRRVLAAGKRAADPEQRRELGNQVFEIRKRIQMLKRGAGGRDESGDDPTESGDILYA